MLQRGGAAAKAAQGPVRQTEVQYRTLNPGWDETFVFSNVDLDATVVVTLYDFDLVGSHDFLGRVEVPIYTLPLDKSVDEWVALEARTEDDEVAGDVFLKACPSSLSYPSYPFCPSSSSYSSPSSLLPLLLLLPLILLRMTPPAASCAPTLHPIAAPPSPRRP